MKKVISVLLFSLFIAFSGRAFAEGACAADKEKFCKDVAHGEGRVAKCLKAHEAELSTECKEQHKQMKEHFKEARQACHDDVIQFCGSVPKGHGAVIKCLHENKEKLSAGCQSQMEPGKTKPKKD